MNAVWIVRSVRLRMALVTFAFAAVAGTLLAHGQTTISKIEQMSGWSSCTVCAGAGGNGKVAVFSMKRGVASPSLDGNATQFSLGGKTPFTSALWWKQLGGKPSAHHFVYDLYFYIKDPTASQALEFDVNQSVGGHKYIFGTECSMKSSATWRVWSAATHWTSTGVPCHVPAAFKWHHVTWEFQRLTTNKVQFISITLDGKKSYVNRTYSPKASGVSELNVAFQMDGNRSQTDYATWVDMVSLRYW